MLSSSFKTTTFNPNEETIEVFMMDVLINANTSSSFRGSFCLMVNEFFIDLSFSCSLNINNFWILPLRMTFLLVTLALGSQPRQGLAKVWTKSEAQETHFMLPKVWECGKVWENEPPHSQVNSHFGNWSPNGLSNLQRVISGVKTHWIEYLFIWLKSS